MNRLLPSPPAGRGMDRTRAAPASRLPALAKDLGVFLSVAATAIFLFLAGDPAGAAPAGGQRPLERASELIGQEVQGSRGEPLGRIADLAVNVGASAIPYAILASDAGRGGGEQWYPVPLDALRRTADGGVLTIDITRDQLAGAEGFDRSDWPALAERRWSEGVRRFYGRPGSEEPSETAGSGTTR